MRTYILRDADGNRIEEPATGLVAAMRQVTERGIKIHGYSPEPDSEHCGGDCSDCNDVRDCVAREQAL